MAVATRDLRQNSVVEVQHLLVLMGLGIRLLIFAAPYAASEITHNRAFKAIIGWSALRLNRMSASPAVGSPSRSRV